jgi:hypothetical protein
VKEETILMRYADVCFDQKRAAAEAPSAATAAAERAAT